MNTPRTVAYFSMEIGLRADMATYSGGLGVLAGDTVHSAADLGLPLVAVTLLHRQGYFTQRLSATGVQQTQPTQWAATAYLQELPARATVSVEGRPVQVRAWQYDVRGIRGATVPVLLLDADLAGNTPADRALTGVLYGGDARYRLAQELLLGLGGVRLLQALGYTQVNCFHLNEGHASFLTAALLEQELERHGRAAPTDEDLAAVRARCVFTTHTPVPAGHDRFPLELVRQVLGPHPLLQLPALWQDAGLFNMTFLALSLSRYANAVSQRHAEILPGMFGWTHVHAITNGVHAGRWMAPPLQALFDRHLPGWREDPSQLAGASSLPGEALFAAHQEAKQALFARVQRETHQEFQLDVLTLGFARRATSYKRADLFFTDPVRLEALSRQHGLLQLIFAGKAHPRDKEGQAMIQHIVQAGTALAPRIRVVYLADYDMTLGGLITAGVDVWLNNPQPPLEASGTSGMKAALNGVPSLSILDGWWVEGCVEGVTGWAIGTLEDHQPQPEHRAQDAAALYDKLERAILPTYYQQPAQWQTIMRACIARNGPVFNTHRMMQEYAQQAYQLSP
jgi:starch phosphorylase